MLNELTELVTIVLAISLASERLVTFLKTVFPSLADDPSKNTAADPKVGVGRKIMVMIIAFLAAWVSSGFLAKSGFMLGEIVIEPNVLTIPCFLMGLLASGGSAFWTNILSYLNSVKDIHTQKLIREKLVTQDKLQKASKTT